MFRICDTVGVVTGSLVYKCRFAVFVCCYCNCCRFATVTVGSENSSRLIFDKLVQKDLHGMLPSISYYTAASLVRLDPSAKKDAPAGAGAS